VDKILGFLSEGGTVRKKPSEEGRQNRKRKDKESLRCRIQKPRRGVVILSMNGDQV